MTRKVTGSLAELLAISPFMYETFNIEDSYNTPLALGSAVLWSVVRAVNSKMDFNEGRLSVMKGFPEANSAIEGSTLDLSQIREEDSKG